MGEVEVKPFVLDDGSTILVVGAVAEVEVADHVDGTLSRSVEVAAWISEAVAAGITFDVLKRIGRDLVKRDDSGDVAAPEADPAAVVDAVLWHLASVGHSEAAIEEIRKVEGQGWVLRGVCLSGLITARADEAGRVIHLRIG